MHPTILKKGTILRIGEGHSELREEAVGIEYRLLIDVPLENGKSYGSPAGKVKKNSTDWPHESIRHQINLNYDTILRYVYTNNKEAKYTLQTLED